MNYPARDDTSALNDARVAWAQPILGNRGSLLYMGPLLNAVAAACRELHVFSERYEGGDVSGKFEITSRNSLRAIESSPDGLYPKGFRYISPRIMLDIRNFRPDLLVANEFSLMTLYGILAAKLLRRTRILLIVENKPYSLGGRILGTLKLHYRRWICRHVDRILTNSSMGAMYLQDSLKVHGNRIIARPYLVSDLGEKIRNESGNEALVHHKPTSGSRIRLLYVGQLIMRKGLDQALWACSRLVSSGIDSFEFRIIGDGPERSRLELLAQQSGLGDHVIFCGKIPYEKLSSEYLAAHAFLFPTLSDYRALAPFEAISTGLPLLSSTRDGGSSETAHDGRNGFTFDPLDTRAMSAAISKLVMSPDLVEEFSRASLEIASHYTTSKAVENLVHACETTLHG